MKLLTADQILAADDLPHKDVPTPEWGKGCGVRVRTMTALERDDWGVEVQGLGANLSGLSARYCALVIVDETGKRLFSPEQIEALGNKNANALQRVMSAAQKLNKMSFSDIEELEKNSEAAPSASSNSPSPGG